MKHVIIFLAAVIASLASKAQQISMTTINAGGKYSNAGGVQLEYAIGEITTAGFNSNHFLYTDGFLQPFVGTASQVPQINNIVLNAGTGIDNAGSYLENAQLSIEFTLGESASITLARNNQMLTQGILQPFDQMLLAPLPVNGFELFVKRINKNQVQLDWKTVQEFNNKGFHIERKKDGEDKFSVVRFVNSKAPAGNSDVPLSYLEVDDNSFPGKSFYRLKQEDLDGSFEYSVIRVVNGEGKSILMKVWPIPAYNQFSLLVSGVEKTPVMIYDVSGRLVKQFTASDGEVIQVNGLQPGSYLIKLKDQDVVQKVVVQ